MARVFLGTGSPLLLLVFRLSKKPPKMVLRRLVGPSLETGTLFDAALWKNFETHYGWESVMGVQEKCDEKREDAAFSG